MSATVEPDEHYNITLKIEKVTKRPKGPAAMRGRDMVQAETERILETLVDLRVQGRDVVQAIAKTTKHLSVEVEEFEAGVSMKHQPDGTVLVEPRR